MLALMPKVRGRVRVGMYGMGEELGEMVLWRSVGGSGRGGRGGQIEERKTCLGNLYFYPAFDRLL